MIKYAILWDNEALTKSHKLYSSRGYVLNYVKQLTTSGFVLRAVEVFVDSKNIKTII